MKKIDNAYVEKKNYVPSELKFNEKTFFQMNQKI